MTWWQMPVPAGWKSMPCRSAKAWIFAYLARLSAEVFWMSWSIAKTGCRGSKTEPSSPVIVLNLPMTADVLSWVMMCLGRMLTKSPAWTVCPGGGPTAWRVAIFSTTVWPIIALDSYSHFTKRFEVSS
jgi:hypothetical protein